MGCGHEARSTRGEAEVSLKGTYILRDGDEADAADRETTAAVRRDRPHVSGERDKESTPGGYCDGWASVNRHGGRARGRGLGDLARRGRTTGRARCADTRRARPTDTHKGRRRPLTPCGMATRRTQPTGRRRRPCRRDRPHVSGESDKESAPGGYCDDWASVRRRGGQARGRGLGDLVRARPHHGTGTVCRHDARSARGRV